MATLKAFPGGIRGRKRFNPKGIGKPPKALNLRKRKEGPEFNWEEVFKPRMEGLGRVAKE